MSWIQSLRRRLRAGAIVAAGVVVLGLLAGSQTQGVDHVFLLQVAACCASLWMLYAEWDEVRAQLWLGRQALAERTLRQPGRWERWPGAWWSLFFTFWASFAGVVLALELPKVPNDPIVLYGVLLAFTLPWTILVYLLLTLALAGLSLLRVRLALRAILPEVRPVLAPVAPWSVALAALGLLVFGAVGRPGATAALAVQGGWGFLELMGSETTEILVELGPDDSIDDPLVALAFAPFADEQAFPDVSEAEDAELARTRVVEVPRMWAASYIRLLDEDNEDFARVELNSALRIEASGPSSPCDPKVSNWPFDPYAGSQPEMFSLFRSSDFQFLARTHPRQPVIVAVIDSGIEADHEDLREAMPDAFSDAGRDHGTHVAGLVGAVGANQRGIVTGNLFGRFVRIRSYPVFAPKGGSQPTARHVVAAMIQAMRDGAKVINLSFGAEAEAPGIMLEAVQTALAHDVLIVASAGNRERGSAATQAVEQWPANIPGVLVVGARDRSGQRLGSSKGLDGIAFGVWAPGERLCTTHLNDEYVTVDGTSFSAAMVSGYAAILRAVRPDWDVATVRREVMNGLR